MAFPQPQRRSSFNPTLGGGLDFRMWRLWPLTYWIIAANIAAFLGQILSAGLLTDLGEFSITSAIFHYQFWRFITFQFLHGGIWHLALNLFALYFFGPIVESRLGTKRFLAFYLICGICGALAYLLLWRLGFLEHASDQGMLGASAGIFGVLVAVVHISPGMAVQLVFPPIYMRIRTLAIIFIGFAVVTILSRGANAGGEAAHIGGALAGWILIKNHHWLNVFDKTYRRRQRFWRPGDPASNFFRNDA